VTIYHGDWRDVAPSVVPDLVLADPPYGVNLKTEYAASQRAALAQCNDYPRIAGDDQPFDPSPFLRWDWSQAQPQYPGLILWGANYYADQLPPRGSWLVWDKINSGDFADCELAWTNLKGAARIFRHMWNGMLRDSERGTPRVHPTQKPILLMAWCLDQAGEVSSVLDPYMGSGTSGIACIQRGLAFTGIEREPRYFDIACKRIEAAYAQGRLFEEPKPDPEQTQIFGDAA
jgi:site-specific DNA-methyltransferase (adenine-specific)/modification methylase